MITPWNAWQKRVEQKAQRRKGNLFFESLSLLLKRIEQMRITGTISPLTRGKSRRGRPAETADSNASVTVGKVRPGMAPAITAPGSRPVARRDLFTRG